MTAPSSSCPHEWRPPQRYTATGPMEGEWLVLACAHCTAAAILDQPGYDGSAFAGLIAQLQFRGLLRGAA